MFRIEYLIIAWSTVTQRLYSHKSENLFKKEPSETDYAPRTGVFLGSEGRWEMGGHRRGEWGETHYLCLIPSAKLHLPMLSWTSFQEMLQPE